MIDDTRPLSRWRAAGYHLVVTLVLAALSALLIFGVWYPQPYRSAAGAYQLAMLLIGIGLLPGPLLMLIVYRKGKKGMSFDIGFIAVLQVAALVYGLFVIAQVRPVFIVVSQDMTYMTMASSVTDLDLADGRSARFMSRSWKGPVQVAALPPADSQGRQDLMDSGLSGKDIDAMPKHFQAMEPAGLRLIANSATFRRLMEHPDTRAAALSFVADHGLRVEDLRFQPLRGRNPDNDTAIVYKLGQPDPVGVIAVDPWPALNWRSSASSRGE